METNACCTFSLAFPLTRRAETSEFPGALRHLPGEEGLKVSLESGLPPTAAFAGLPEPGWGWVAPSPAHCKRQVPGRAFRGSWPDSEAVCLEERGLQHAWNFPKTA